MQWRGAATAAAILLLLAPACGGGSGAEPASSPPAETGAGASSGQAGARATPTLVPFFKKLDANGTPTVLTLDSILPGATCAVSVTVPNPDAAGRTLTFTARDGQQFDRAQPDFMVYHSSTTFTAGSFSSTANSSRSPARTL